MIEVKMVFQSYDEMLEQFGLVRLDSIKEVHESAPPVGPARGHTRAENEAPVVDGEKVAAEPEDDEPSAKTVVKKAQELAEEYGIDPMTLEASGSGNRVLVRDVQKAIDSRGVDKKPEPEPSVDADDTEYTVDDCRIATKYLLDAKGLPVVQDVLREFEVSRVKDLLDEDLSRYVRACVEAAGKPGSDWMTFLSEQKAA